MALKVNNTSYDGEVLDELLVRATTGNDLVAGGHIRVEDGVQKSFSIPRLKTGAMLQKRKEQPKEGDAKGDFNYDERKLTPQEFMAFTTFNPRTFEKVWRPFQPTGNLVFRELPAEVQNKLLSEMAKAVDFELGYHYINGEFGAAEGKYFDGILTRIVADADVVKDAGATALVDHNILSALRSVTTKLPKPLKTLPLKNKVKIFMSVEDHEIYDFVLTEKPFKGADYSSMSSEKFKGYQLVPLANMPKDVMFATYATDGIDSNLWAAVDLADDEDVIKIDLLENAGERYFFKMLMKVDTNIAFGEDVVLWDGRGVPAPPAPAAAPLAAPAAFAAPASAPVAAPLSVNISVEEITDEVLQEIADKKKELEDKEKELERREKALLEKEAATTETKVPEVKADNTKLTKAAIKRLNRNGLEALIAENKLEIEIKEGMTNAQLSDKIIEALPEGYFSEEATGDKAE